MVDVRNLIEGLAADPTVAVEISVGTPHFGYGQVDLVVAGDGKLIATRRREGDDDSRYEGHLDGDRLRALADELRGLELDELASGPGPRKPDDEPLSIRIRHDGRLAHEAALHHADRFDDQRVDRLLRRYEALVEEVSGGALPFGEGAG